MRNIARKYLLAEVASKYYKDKLTQEDIAAQLGYSRSAVSRLLTEAEREGIISVEINYPLQREASLENRLKEIYGLDDAMVVQTGSVSYAEKIRMTGHLGALYIEPFLVDDCVVDISWGRSVYEIIDALPNKAVKHAKVVQAIGASGVKSDPRIDGFELARLMAEKLNATYYLLNAPLAVDSAQTRAIIMNLDSIKRTLDLAYHATLGIFGIGSITLDKDISSVYRTGFLSEEEIHILAAQGAVANVCAWAINEQGEVLDCDVNQRMIAADFFALRDAPTRIIGVAAGERKAQAIQAVLRSKFLDVLITDSTAAELLI